MRITLVILQCILQDLKSAALRAPMRDYQTQLKNIGRVLCRQLDNAQLERITALLYHADAGVPFSAFCSGYENSFKDCSHKLFPQAECHPLGLECSSCFQVFRPAYCIIIAIITNYSYNSREYSSSNFTLLQCYSWCYHYGAPPLACVWQD